MTEDTTKAMQNKKIKIMPKQSWKYHKIMSIFKRDRVTNKFIIGEYSTPEIEYLKDNQWIFTEKVDGTNLRISYDGKDTLLAGRSDNAQIPVPLIYKIDELFKTFTQRQKLEEAFEMKEDDMIYFYGEGYGAKIQKGGGNYIKDGVNFVLFDVRINNTYLERENVEDIAKKLGLDIVPIIGQDTIADGIEIVKKGFNSKWGDFTAEGIVARPKVELVTRRGDRIITKIKYKDFH